MFDILEMEFKGRRKEYAANPMEFPFALGDAAIVDVQRGLDLGRISTIGLRPGIEPGPPPTLTVIRRAAEADFAVLEQNRQREADLARAAKQKILDHQLEMKLVDVELQWDGRKISFYFTAEGRVDFRELVKDLAASFRTRIDLRQIGARDETKRTQGYGVCGEHLCCERFLTEFKPITTQMPRDQFLPLNPSKLSGVCGRLKCCMRYELDMYRDFQRQCPKVGHALRDESKGEGVVDKLDLIREQIFVRYNNGEIERVSPPEFQATSNWRPEMPKNEPIQARFHRPAAPAAPPTVKIEEPVATGGKQAGEKVTLLAGGGLGMKGTEGSAEVRVGESLEMQPDAPKKKRKRRRRKKSGGAATPNAPQDPTPPDDDNEDDGDEE
jgi:cell fate regulator YaaT (PSP1 superfamily)